jgi:di/tricarboxylate transporter
MTASLLPPALLVIATIALWATARLPEYLTAMIFFAVATVTHMAAPEVIFSGFASAAFWLVLSGFVLGAAIRKVGLADRIAAVLSGQLNGSWPRMVAGVVLITYALAFVMPSNMSRIALLMPIVLALADRVGLPEGTRGRIGLALAVGLGTYELSASILPANVPNLVMAGAAESAYGLRLAYLPYLLLHAPVLGIVKGIVLTVVICLLFPATPTAAVVQTDKRPFSAAEKRLSVLLILTLAMWVTDTLHGISPAWVGLTAACVCMLPRVGFLTNDEFATAANIRTGLYIAGILGLTAWVGKSGLGAVVGRALVSLLPLDPAAPFRDFAALSGLTGVLNFVVTANGVPAMFTPLAQSLSVATGFSLTSVLMTQVIGYATPLLPYQAGPIVLAMSLGKVPSRDGLKLCLVLAAVTYLLLLPLDWLWFRLLGAV